MTQLIDFKDFFLEESLYKDSLLVIDTGLAHDLIVIDCQCPSHILAQLVADPDVVAFRQLLKVNV